MNTMEYEIQHFSNLVKQLRRDHGLTKKDMAHLLEISLYHYNKIERGELPPRMGVSVLFAIYDHFGVLPQDQLNI